MEIYKIFIDQNPCLTVQTHVVVIEQADGESHPPPLKKLC